MFKTKIILWKVTIYELPTIYFQILLCLLCFFVLDPLSKSVTSHNKLKGYLDNYYK